MIVIIGFVLERQPCLSEWQVAESFPVTPNDSDQEYALNITPKLYWPDSTTLQYNSIDNFRDKSELFYEGVLSALMDELGFDTLASPTNSPVICPERFFQSIFVFSTEFGMIF